MGSGYHAEYSDDEFINKENEVTSISEVKNKLTKWEKEPTLQDLKEDFEGAKNEQSLYISKLTGWNKLYDAPKFGNKETKGSRVSPKLVQKQVEWRCPALSEPFLSTNNLYEVKPLTFEDTARASQNSLILNRQFNLELDKVNLVDGIIRRLAKDGTVVVRTGWRFKEVTITEKVMEYSYSPVENEEELGQIYEQLAELQHSEPDSYEQTDEVLKAGFEMSMEKGMLLEATPVREIDQQVKKTIINKPTVDICNIRNVYIDPTCKGDIKKAQFVVYSYESSLSELRKDGNYTNLDKFENYEESGSMDHDGSNLSFKFKDNARKKVIVYEYWGYRDIDGSGETTSFMASWIGDTIIRMEENPFPDAEPPFVVFKYIPVEDDIHGIPDAELLGDNQNILGAVTRGMIDIMGKSANAQMGYSKNFLDSSNRIRFRNGEDYEFNQGFDPRVHTHMHKFPEIPASAFQMMQMVNNDSESLSGIKAFGQDGLNAVNFGNTATGVRGVLDAVSKRELSILRRISEGFKEVGRKIISMNAEFLSEEETVRITNSEFIKVRRDDLAGNYDITLTISTAEADNATAEELAFMLQTMGDKLGQDVMKMILAKIATLRKMPDLAKEIENYAPEPDPFQQEMQQLELEYKKAEIAKLNAEAMEIEAQSRVYNEKVNVENARARSLEGDAGNKAIEFAERESGIKHNNEMAKQKAINEGGVMAQQVKASAQSEQLKDKHNLDLLKKAAEMELQSANTQPAY